MGWGGPRLGLTLDELNEKDETITSNEIDIIFQKSEKDYVDHSIIDFEDSFLGRGFTVRSMMPGTC
jgi:Fe-S cluster assembly iron-binding protein IscA